MNKIEKIRNRPYDIYFMILMPPTQLLNKDKRPLMCLHRLRRMLLFVEKCIDGTYPQYLNVLFVVNRGSNSRKLNMLVQPKFNSKY